jgi:hypothetical protein
MRGVIGLLRGVFTRGKKGEGLWELYKIIIAVAVLVIMAAATIFLLGGKSFGEEGLIAGIKKMLKFGRA